MGVAEKFRLCVTPVEPVVRATHPIAPDRPPSAAAVLAPRRRLTGRIMMRRIAALLAALLLTPLSLALEIDSASVKSRIDRAIRRAGLTTDQVGYTVLTPQGGTLLAQNGDRRYVVASNNKVVTTAAALTMLGPDFTWTTSLMLRGRLDGNTWVGDLWVRGNGDPNISGRDNDGDPLFLFRRWGRTLKALGIERITGDLRLDDTAFDDQGPHPTWLERYLGNWFAAETSALSFSDNCVSVRLHAPKSSGRLVSVSLFPPSPIFEIDNHCSTHRSRRSTWGVHRSPDANRIRVTGRLPAGRSPEPVWVAVHQPTLYFGTVLMDTLRAEGIHIEGSITRAPAPRGPAPDLRTVDTFTSRLAESVIITNKRSQNLYAEQILKTMGLKQEGLGTFENGLKAVERFLSQCVGVDNDTYVQVDGSGLSYENLFTPETMARILWSSAQSAEGSILRESLPVAGLDGTLKNRLRDSPLRMRVRAKTGFLAGVSGLSGYLDGPDGEVYPFSILVNAEGKPKSTMVRAEHAILEETWRALP